MQQAPVYDPTRPWDRIQAAVHHAANSANLVDSSDGRYRYPEWAWLDDPLPHEIEAEIVGTAAAFNWPSATVRRDTRKQYYEELRRVEAHHAALHYGRHLTFPVAPQPIERLPVNVDLSLEQQGFLHASGQAVAESRRICENEHHNWIGILDYGGWLVADPRHLEGEVPELEARHAAFIAATRKQIPRSARTPQLLRSIEVGARLALYHSYWHRLNVRRDRLILAGRRAGSAFGGRKPAPQPYGVSHEGAEHLCGEWMTYLGATNVGITPPTRDGGIDILSDRAIAQVKNYSGTVGVEDVRAFHGVVLVDGRLGVFFTSGTYSRDAIAFAERAGMPLMTYNAVAGTLLGANAIGEAVLSVGM